jgi:hypothetical protein
MATKKALSRNYFFASDAESAFNERQFSARGVARKMKALSLQITAAA